MSETPAAPPPPTPVTVLASGAEDRYTRKRERFHISPDGSTLNPAQLNSGNYVATHIVASSTARRAASDSSTSTDTSAGFVVFGYKEGQTNRLWHDQTVVIYPILDGSHLASTATRVAAGVYEAPDAVPDAGGPVVAEHAEQVWDGVSGRTGPGFNVLDDAPDRNVGPREQSGT